MRGNPRQPRVNKTHRGPSQRDRNARHEFQMSAVKEFCICGMKETDPVHLKLTRKKTQEADVIQVGITPDCPMARTLVSGLMDWTFVEKIGEGVWNVETASPWPPGVSFDATIVAPRTALPPGADEGGLEVHVTLEWP